ncbi:MAG: major facilitator super transporter protein [Piccolia ochrophora]|nr:MAG: major facilitator super transporter protein [Piccolia ochrophora]
MARWGKPTLLALLVAIALIPMAAIIFAVGFFPYKPFLPGLAEHSGWNHESFPSPPFDKIIFMVVDALRSDFVYSHASGFRFTQQLISRGAAIPFTAHAASPTITMPRVKALTTGSVPSFLDVILNFAESDTTSTLAQQDTWLAQMKALKEGNMIMYGDDTWLKLFPETFDRTDGTSSFFVSDFTEVDYNVTRHVSHELRSTDWHTMIMHYLGLDHIGHKAGPRSPNMVPKQQEMDGIVRQIYEAIEGEDHLQSTLLVLCGDHGMNDAGNHGGSSEGETSSALVFVSPKFQQISRGSRCPIETPLDLRFYSVVEQSDITPTLAGLLGLPIPRNNLGVFIPSLLELWSRGEDKVHLLLSNARQILKLVQAGFPSMGFEGHGEVTECSEALSAPEALACQWTNIVRSMEDQAHTTDAIRRDQQESLLRFCHEAQHLMSQTASNYDTSKLTTGIMSAVVAVAMVSVMLQSVTKSLKIWAGLWLVPVTYGGMMFASSFVEEEQHFWYWSTSSWLIYLTANVTRSEARGSSFHALLALGALVGLRVTRRWNQTGQKFAGHRDIARHFLPSHTSVMWTMIAATYLYAMYRVSARSVRLGSSAVSLAASISLCFTALVFKAAFTSADAPELLGDFPHWTKNTLNYMSLIVQARVVFSGLALFTLRTLVSGRKNMRHELMLIAGEKSLFRSFMTS